MKCNQIKTFNNRYRVVEKLGRGANGTVYLVEDIKNSTISEKIYKALKCMKLDCEIVEDINNLEKEALILSNLRHPFILRFYESFREGNMFCIVTEYCEGGDLSSYLKNIKDSGEILDEKVVGKWFVQLLLAVVFIHKQNILHRDLKTSNIFLKNGDVIIGDFGISRTVNTVSELITTFIGTPYYMSPEVLTYEGYNNKSDIWSLGVILYELCTQRRVFNGTNLMRVMWQVVNESCPQLPSIYSKELQEVFALMLCKNPLERPSALEILRSNYVLSHIQKLYMELLIKCNSDPNSNGQSSGLRSISFDDFINSDDVATKSTLSIDFSVLTENQKEVLNSLNRTNLLTVSNGKAEFFTDENSDKHVKTLRDFTENLILSQKFYGQNVQQTLVSTNHILPTVQMSTEKLLKELKNLYTQNSNKTDYDNLDSDDDLEKLIDSDFENTLVSSHNSNEISPDCIAEGPGAEDSSLGSNFSLYSDEQQNSTEKYDHSSFHNVTSKYTHQPLNSNELFDLNYKTTNLMPSSNSDINKFTNHDNGQILFVRRGFTIPADKSSDYRKSAKELYHLNHHGLIFKEAFSDDTQLVETFYSQYENELVNYLNESSEIPETKTDNQNDECLNQLEDLEEKSSEDQQTTINDVLDCMKAALQQSLDSYTDTVPLICGESSQNIYGPEAREKKIETIQKYCIEKLGLCEFQSTYDYLYNKRIIEHNISGELTILTGLRKLCPNITLGFLIDQLLFLQYGQASPHQNDVSNVSQSVNQIFEERMKFCL